LTARRVFRSHRDITPYAVASPRRPAAVHVMAAGIAAQFERAGFTGERAATAYHALATYTLGSGVLEAQRAIVDRSIRAPVSDLASAVGAPPPSAGGVGETYTAVLGAMEDDPDLARFERGLRAIMAGLLATGGD
ncbi:MAG: TetR/AcrR family transcriptional regulator C-terminal domain-containing protein, partial [Acidimicrobiales bacterium]|nr:TetR/AcrR family transcriptional regulator C-terminal domain-containing protein [Acidimicrobiales bacterium]